MARNRVAPCKPFDPIRIELRKRRRALGLRQIDLSERAGYPEFRIIKWETGRETPRTRALLDWCEALGVTLAIVGPPIGPELRERSVRPPYQVEARVRGV